MKIKTPLLILLSLILSVFLAYTFDAQNKANSEVAISDEVSLVPQKSLGMYDEPIEITRLFYHDKTVWLSLSVHHTYPVISEAPVILHHLLPLHCWLCSAHQKCTPEIPTVSEITVSVKVF